MENWTYDKAGVNVTAGYEAVRLMKKHAERTYTPSVLGGLGSFGALFRIPQGYSEPVLVSGTDGVGTKLQLAFMTGKHNTVGIDCVAMCVNDIICQGAKPLFFLDYIGTGVLDPEQAAAIVEGVSEGCLQAGCALVGGETAEMPGFYKQGEYDMAGVAVGIAEQSKLITGKDIMPGDKLIGIASSGLHSNGYSLARKLCFEQQGFTHDQYIEPLGAVLGDALLTPTKIYVSLLFSLMERFTIKGVANITGGGWIENIPRIFGDKPGLKAAVSARSVTAPPIFGLLKQWGNMKDEDMYGVFNMGIGFVLAVDKAQADDVLSAVEALGEKGFIIGEVMAREAGEEPIVID